MEREASGSSKDFFAVSRRFGRESQAEEDRYYTQKFDAICPVDSSKVVHTVTFRKATCSRVDDMVEDFHCNRNSACVKCTENYW